MKKTLLASVAAAALIAGPAIAQKQEGPATKSEAPARAPAAVQNAPAEKIAPAGKVAPDKAASESKSPKSETTGQASPSTSTPGAADTKASDKPGATTDTKAQTRSGASTDTQASTKASTNTAALSTEQKAKIRTTVLTANAPRVTNVNFSLNVGTVVPRSVRLVAVPAPLIEIHPAWRGFMYFVHGDEIIIVEPGTLKIVAVVSV